MKHSRKHTFALSLALSLFVFLTLAGCAIVDTQAAASALGTSSRPSRWSSFPMGKPACRSSSLAERLLGRHLRKPGLGCNL